MNEKLKWGKVITFGGALIAASIGAAFASGQEPMQFFTSYGYQCVWGILTFILILMYTSWSFAHTGTVCDFKKSSDVFEYYCGKVIGKIFDLFVPISCYIIFIVMLAGAASTINEQFGVPLWIGGIFMAVLSLATVVFGFKSLVDTIGKIGPIMVFMIAIVIVFTLIRDFGKIPLGAMAIATNKVELMKISNNSIMAGANYSAIAITINAMFLSQMGNQNKEHKKEVILGVVLGVAVLGVTVAAQAFSLMANVEEMVAVQIPNLILANRITPWFATFFAIVIIAAIYTTAAPLLWTPVSRFTKEKTKSYYILTIVLTIIAIVVVFFVPFATLINVTSAAMGYVGLALLVFLIVKDVRILIAKK